MIAIIPTWLAAVATWVHSDPGYTYNGTKSLSGSEEVGTTSHKPTDDELPEADPVEALEEPVVAVLEPVVADLEPVVVAVLEPVVADLEPVVAVLEPVVVAALWEAVVVVEVL
jgi:hypothetical protein